ncbi:NAD(P)/FAD-dependent oxidoreductase [Siculibacillus lacustris]|nr:FAD-dependent oxidoreductase [Siculibacillus lacustris]
MSTETIVVLGAGAVGVCTAFQLARDGHAVTLIDRLEPGGGCSRGNAGLIQSASVVPVATPGTLAAVPRMLLDPDQPLFVRWRHLPTLAPYLLRFLLAARPAQVEASSRALATIVPHAYEAWRPVLAAAGAADLVRPAGELHVYETDAARRGADFAMATRRARGVEVRELTVAELAELEPALAPIFRHAVYLPAAHQTADPFVVVGAVAQAFAAAGGRILRAAATDLRFVEGRPTAVVTEAGDVPFDRLVIALGAHSKPWARRLGSPVPLDAERGYHLMLPEPGVSLNTAVVSGDFKFAMTRLAGGLRLAGTAELATVDAAPDERRARRLLPLARRLLPGLDGRGAVPWMGPRPSLPDSLPVISRSPHHPSVVFAFGHGHSGLSLAALTGAAVADLVAGRPPAHDLAPFDIRRFDRRLRAARPTASGSFAP